MLTKTKDKDRGKFLEAVIKKLCSKSEKVVLVSPANSGNNFAIKLFCRKTKIPTICDSRLRLIQTRHSPLQNPYKIFLP